MSKITKIVKNTKDEQEEEREGGQQITYDKLLQQELDPLLSNIPLDLVFNVIAPFSPSNMAQLNKMLNLLLYPQNVDRYLTRLFTMDHGPRLYSIPGETYKSYNCYKSRLWCHDDDDDSDNEYDYVTPEGITVRRRVNHDESDEEDYDSDFDYSEVVSGPTSKSYSPSFKYGDTTPTSTRYVYARKIKPGYLENEDFIVDYNLFKRTSLVAVEYRTRVEDLFIFLLYVIMKGDDAIFERILKNDDTRNEHLNRFIWEGLLPVHRQDLQPLFYRSRQYLIKVIFASGTNKMVSFVLDMIESSGYLRHTKQLRDYSGIYASRSDFDLCTFKKIMQLRGKYIFSSCILATNDDVCVMCYNRIRKWKDEFKASSDSIRSHLKRALDGFPPRYDDSNINDGGDNNVEVDDSDHDDDDDKDDDDSDDSDSDSDSDYDEIPSLIVEIIRSKKFNLLFGTVAKTLSLSQQTHQSGELPKFMTLFQGDLDTKIPYFVSNTESIIPCLDDLINVGTDTYMMEMASVKGNKESISALANDKGGDPSVAINSRCCNKSLAGIIYKL